jgi:hypothetical protein
MLYIVVYMEYCRYDMGREPVRKSCPLETKGESIKRKREKIDRGIHPVQEENDCRGTYLRFSRLVSNMKIDIS